MRSELDKVLTLPVPREEKEMLLFRNVIRLLDLDIPLSR
jgi:hypothetical protein